MVKSNSIALIDVGDHPFYTSTRGQTTEGTHPFGVGPFSD